MPRTMKIGIVTVTFNSGGVIDDFMASVLAQTHGEFLLYIFDNASTDDTLARVARYEDRRVRLTASPQNTGFSVSNNQGIRAALQDGCDSVLLINNDTVFGPELLETLVAASERQRCDMAVPKIYCHDRPGTLWFAGGYFSPWRAFANGHDGMGEIDHGQFDQARKIAFAPMCCMLIQAPVFDRIGLLDEKYFVYFEDADFCLRANRAGLRTLYIPQATVQHKVSSLTGGDESTFTIQHMVRNRVYFIRKNLRPLAHPYCLLFFQARYWMRLLLRKDSLAVFSLRQQAFLQGLALPTTGDSLVTKGRTR